MSGLAASVTAMRSPAAPTALPYPAYLEHIRAESARFRAVIAQCDPGAQVPSCPEWTASDLLWHLGGGVQHFWTQIVRQRPAGPDACVEAERPDSWSGLLEFFDTTNADFLAALEAADPAEPAWSWSPDQTVGFTFRRQAHEVLIHRLDAELTLGDVTPLDPVLAADGVHEALAVMFGGLPAWGRREPLPGVVRVDCTDTDTQVWVGFALFSGTSPEGTEYVDEQEVYVLDDDPGTEPDLVVEGTAKELDTWIWHRGDGSRLGFAGDPEIRERFVRCLDQPIE